MSKKRNNSFFNRYIRASFTFVPSKPAYTRGLRVATIIGIPLLIGLQFGILSDTSLFVLAALNISLLDMGGMTYRNLSRTLFAVTVLNAIAAVVAILVGSNIIFAVVATAIWVASVAMLGLTGHTGVMIALVNSVVFVIMIFIPGSEVYVLKTFITFLAGGVWAMLFSLVTWPISPYRPIRKAVARCFVENANFLRILADHCNYQSLNNSFKEDLEIIDLVHLKFRQSIDEAHEMLINERKGRLGNNNVEVALISLLHSVAKDYRTLVTTMVWFTSTGHKINKSNSVFFYHLFISLAKIHDEIANIIMHPDNSSDELIRLISNLQQEQLLGENKIIVGEYAEIQHILGQLLNRIEQELVTAKRQHPSHKNSNRNSNRISLITEPKISLITQIKKNITFASPGFRHAIRIGTTTAVAVLIAHISNLPHGYWLPLTVIVIMAPDFGGSFLVRSLQRGVGTTLGGLLAAFLLLNIHNEIQILILLIIFTFFAISLLTINYALFVFFLTPLVVTMYSLSGSDSWGIAYDRVTDTILGIGLSLIGGQLLFPVWERNVYVRRFSSLLDTVNKYFKEILSSFNVENVSQKEILRLSREIEVALVATNASFQQALNQPGFNTKLIPYLISFLNSTNRLIRGIVSLHEYSYVNKIQFSKLNIFIVFGQKISDLLSVISKIISSQKPNQIQFDDKVIKLLEKMDSLLNDIENEHIKSIDNQKYDRNVVSVEISRILEIVQNMADDLKNITSVNMGISTEDDYLVSKAISS